MVRCILVLFLSIALFLDISGIKESSSASGHSELHWSKKASYRLNTNALKGGATEAILLSVVLHFSKLKLKCICRFPNLKQLCQNMTRIQVFQSHYSSYTCEFKIGRLGSRKPSYILNSICFTVKNIFKICNLNLSMTHVRVWKCVVSF